MAYIGREPQIGNYQVCDAISVVNGQAAYTMQVSSVNVLPESVNHMIVSLNGVIQKPGSSYTISGATITFSSNLATGDSIDFIYLLGNTLDLGTPSDDTVTGAKIVDNAINSEHYTDGSIDTAHIADLNVTTGKIAADAITGAKIADDAINSEHYTDGSIDTAHIAADQITEAKIADNAISEEHLDVTAVTGHTAETTIADGDLVLIHDASASALRKMTKANFVSGVGGLSEVDQWRITANVTSDADITSNLERGDSSGQTYIGTGMSESSGIFTFPSTGKYMVEAHMYAVSGGGNGDDMRLNTNVTTNNSSYGIVTFCVSDAGDNKDTGDSSKYLFDVTNTSNDKVKFSLSGRDDGGSTLYGSSDYNYTYFTFSKLVST